MEFDYDPYLRHQHQGLPFHSSTPEQRHYVDQQRALTAPEGFAFTTNVGVRPFSGKVDPALAVNAEYFKKFGSENVRISPVAYDIYGNRLDSSWAVYLREGATPLSRMQRVMRCLRPSVLLGDLSI